MKYLILLSVILSFNSFAQRNQSDQAFLAARQAGEVNRIAGRAGNIECDENFDEERMNKLHSHCESPSGAINPSSRSPFWARCEGQGSICVLDGEELAFKPPTHRLVQEQCPSRYSGQSSRANETRHHDNANRSEDAIANQLRIIEQQLNSRRTPGAPALRCPQIARQSGPQPSLCRTNPSLRPLSDAEKCLCDSYFE